MPDPKDPYDGIPTYAPDPDFVADETGSLPNPPDPETGLRE